jgi:mannose-6-phosphate isomerase
MLWFFLSDIIEEGRHNKMNEIEHRPWGFYEVLSDEEDHKVKRITVEPGKRLSLQRHKLRREHWFVVHGESIVTVNDNEIKVAGGQAIDIPQGSLHRIANTGTERLVYIEVQLGSYFGEDDIERVEDDYGRI